MLRKDFLFIQLKCHQKYNMNSLMGATKLFLLDFLFIFSGHNSPEPVMGGIIEKIILIFLKPKSKVVFYLKSKINA